MMNTIIKLDTLKSISEMELFLLEAKQKKKYEYNDWKTLLGVITAKPQIGHI